MGKYVNDHWKVIIKDLENRRVVVRVSKDVPQVGTLAFGIVDRGTNVIEVRPTSLCPLSCIYCSVNAGPRSTNRWAEFTVDVDALITALEDVIRFKGINDAEIHIDGMGEPGVYPYLTDLVRNVRSISGVAVVSMQTRLYMLNEDKLKELANAGLDRINLSIDTLNPEKAVFLTGTSWYNVNRVVELVKVALDLGINVVASPVWLPGINDDDIKELITWAKNTGLGMGKIPPILIQKYIPHKRGRKVKVKVMPWGEFWRRLRNWERELGVKLTMSNEELNIHKAPELPRPFKVHDEVKVRIINRGLMRGEYLGIIMPFRNDTVYDRAITVVAKPQLERFLVNNTVRIKILENDHNIYIGQLIT